MGERSLFSATLCSVLNNLSDFRWPPKYFRSRERQANRGLESWVHQEALIGPTSMLICKLKASPVPAFTPRA